MAIAWAISAAVNPDPSLHGQGLNVPAFGLKWFVYTFAMAATVYVLAPYLAVFGIGAIWQAVSRNRNYWSAHRIAIVVAAVWVVIGHVGLWCGLK